MTVSFFTSYIQHYLISSPSLDVEHVVPNSSKQGLTSTAPQLHFEGFEPSPYQLDDARAELEEGPVRSTP